MALIGSGNSLGGIAGSNAVARLLVVISGNSTGLDAAIAQANGSIAGLGANAGAIGKTLTRTATLPLLALGGVAVKMASDFQTAMGRVAGLTPILDDSGKSVQELSEDILAMSQDLPTAPVELANALYFAGSAGLDAATAMNVVRLSAEGAAVGMGEAADISKVLIFALNNYEDAGLTATSAMDSLTVAIREGTAEPADLAVALGRLLPVAKEAGVTFEEVVGSVAALTNVGFPARVATTSLRALFSELLAPTEAATNTMNQLGLTSVQVADTLKTGGPIAAFQLLEAAVHGDDEALHDIVPQIRGFSAYLALTDQEMAKSAEIFTKTATATGTFQRALSIIQETPQFKFETALNKLRVAGIQLGAQLLPVFLRLVEIIGTVGDVLANLPKPALAALAALITLGAAAGPILQLYGALTATKTAAGGFFTLAGTQGVPTLKAMTTGFITVGIAAVAAVGGFQSLTSGMAGVGSLAITLIGTFVALKVAITGLQAMVNAAKWTNALSLAFASLSTGGIALVAGLIAGIVTAIGYFIGQSNKAQAEANQMGDALSEGAQQGASLQQALDNIKTDEIREELQKLAKDMGVLNQPANVALPAIQGGVGQDLVNQLDHIVLGFQKLSPAAQEGLGTFKEYVAATRTAVANGQQLSFAFEEAGLESSSLNGSLEDIAGTLSGTNPEIANAAATALDLALQYPQITKAIQEYDDTQFASIISTEASKQATEDYANSLGVSSDFLQTKLDEAGVSAVEMSDRTRTSFETMSFGAESTSVRVNAAMAEMDAAVKESVGGIIESMAGGFDLFSKIDDKVNKTTGKLIGLVQAQSTSILQETANLRTLSERGLSADLLAKLADQGPGYVAKFVDASAGELKRLQVAYDTTMGALDASILEEAAHQQVKGHNMVADFTQAILSSSQLPAKAASQIVNMMTTEFGKGNLTGQGLKLMQQFVGGLGKARNLSRAQGAAAARVFADGLVAGDFVNKAGRIIVGKLAKGLQSGAGVTRQQAREIASTFSRQVEQSAHTDILPTGKVMTDQFAKGISQGEGDVGQGGKGIARAGAQGASSQDGAFRTAGHGAGAAFANGLAGTSGLAETAARQVAADAKAAFDKALHNSPEYFTYYMGRKLMDDMGRGLSDGNRALQAHRPNVTLDVTGDRRAQEDSLSRAIAKGIREGQGDTVVQIDGREVVRAGKHHHMRRNG